MMVWAAAVNFYESFEASVKHSKGEKQTQNDFYWRAKRKGLRKHDCEESRRKKSARKSFSGRRETKFIASI